MIADNYTITNETIKAPPVSLRSKFKFLGPGFILSASIVGSGELIATTVLGAKGGFVVFWVIIVSCLVKVAIQLEFGKQAILSGKTPMQSFSKLPGPKLGKSNWTVATVFFLSVLKIVQVGGMLGGSALVLGLLFPSLPVMAWAIVVALLVAMIISKNYYKIIEQSSLVMVVAFTVLTITSLVAVSFTPYRFTMGDIVAGLQFELPSHLVILAIGAFGITGVASDEIISYNYWCIEKGYAAYTGPIENTEEWKKRARGWTNVMYLDAFVAMIIYTTVTAAFYILGASILHNRGEIPEGNSLIETIGNIYTQSLGNSIRTAYLIGAFFVLSSSVFATLAYWTRLFSDIFDQFGWIDFSNASERKKTIFILSWVFPLLWVITYLFIQLPVLMIISGGVIGSVLLLVVVFAALCFRYNKKYPSLKSSGLNTLLFWFSVVPIAMIAVYGLVKLFN